MSTVGASVTLSGFPALAPFIREVILNKDLKNLPEEEKWCIYLKYRKEKYAGELVQALCQTEEGIMRAERALKRVSRNYEKWARALFREKAVWDYTAGIDSAREYGLEEGRAEGYERARKESYQEKLEIARKMKGRGRPLAEIVEDTGLPPETVEKL